MDVRVRMGDAIDPFHLANGFEAVIGYECQERSNPLSLTRTIHTSHARCDKASEWVGGSLQCNRGILVILWMSLFGETFHAYPRLTRWTSTHGGSIQYSVMLIRGNGVTLRTQKVIQGGDNGHVGRPCEVSLAPPCPELFCELRGLCRHSYFGPRTCGRSK